MRNFLYAMVILLTVISCKKEKSSNNVSIKIEVDGSVQSYSFSLVSQDGKRTYINEANNTRQKTFTATVPKDEELAIRWSSSVNYGWKFKVYRDGILTREEALISGGGQINL